MYIISKNKFSSFAKILKKYEVPFAQIGTVKNHNNLVIHKNGKTIAKMPSHLIDFCSIVEPKK